jgi:hemerythrin superfamily protein
MEDPMTTTSKKDILTLLDADHRTVEQQFVKLGSAAPHDREALFCELVQMLVGHEVAEEVVVYPAIRSEAPHGDAEADARIKEQAAAEKKLATMEDLDPESAEFAAQLAQLKTAVIKHATAEEQEIFPLIKAVEDEAKRAEMGGQYERAKANAPTHPHPHVPDTPPGNKVLGPVAALFDKARDAAARA